MNAKHDENRHAAYCVRMGHPTAVQASVLKVIFPTPEQINPITTGMLGEAETTINYRRGINLFSNPKPNPNSQTSTSYDQCVVMVVDQLHVTLSSYWIEVSSFSSHFTAEI